MGLVDWKAKLERANGEIAELHVRISFQNEIVKQLAATGADTTLAQRILDIRKERLAHVLRHAQFIAGQIGYSNKGPHSFSDPGYEPLQFRWDKVR
jgi:hypothetical protein